MGHATSCQLPACCLVRPSALSLQSAVGALLPFPPSSSMRRPGMAWMAAPRYGYSLPPELHIVPQLYTALGTAK